MRFPLPDLTERAAIRWSSLTFGPAYRVLNDGHIGKQSFPREVPMPRTEEVIMSPAPKVRDLGSMQDRTFVCDSWQRVFSKVSIPFMFECRKRSVFFIKVVKYSDKL